MIFVLRFAPNVPWVLGFRFLSHKFGAQMESFKASVQYGDWEGTAAADNADFGNSIREYLDKKQLIKPGEFLIATSLWVGENHNRKLGTILVRAFLLKGHQDFESVKKT
jgi:hypothetical protein